MKKSMLLLSTVLFAFISTFAQVDKMKDILEDETDSDNFTIRFYNALDGQPIKSGTVTIDEIGEFTTDAEGKIKFPRLDEDQVLLLNFKADGFIETDVKTEIVAGTIFYNRISISPEMSMENVRIILDWGRNPDDLDAHLEKKGSYHVSYRDMKTTDDGEARLDRDDRDSWGPETITIEEVETDADYTYWVHDFSNRTNENSKKLSKSKAVVKIYASNELQYTIKVPESDRGNKWQVFTITGGEIKVNSYLTSTN
jgi:hypothetical protein